jgi:hypothetical protein
MDTFRTSNEKPGKLFFTQGFLTKNGWISWITLEFKKIFQELKMKKLIILIAMTLFPALLIVGCKSTNSIPSGPSGPTPTPTATVAVVQQTTVTPPTTVQATVNLGAAANYGVLAYSAITNSGSSSICGDLGLYPLSSVSGGIVLTCGGVREIDNGTADTAKLNLGTAYTNAMGRTSGAALVDNADIGGLTLYPGLYIDGGNLSIASADLTLDAQGNSNAVFIFQVAGILNATSGRQVILANGANAANVFWAVAGYCSLGTTVSFAGTIMTYTSVTLNTGAVLNGRALAENGDVTLLGNTITDPTP